MKSVNRFGTLLWIAISAGWLVAPASGGLIGPTHRFETTGTSPRVQDRAEAIKELQNGNYRDAYATFEQLCLDPNTAADQISRDLINAVSCLQNLGEVNRIDDLLEGTVEAHAENWRLLQTAANQYLGIDHNGFIISGKFERGGHRGGGEPANAMQRDRVRALQLMRQALPLAQDDDNKTEVASFYLSLSNHLLANRGYADAWRLQSLTDLNELPDVEEGYFAYYYYSQPGGAPVDADGNPVFHDLPDGWEESTTDGERWRWCLSMIVENDGRRLNEVRNMIASFARAQFGVPTLQSYGWYFPRRDTQDDDDESGTYALHTLAEDETIARLATGIKRFQLPDDYNFIKIYQSIAAEPDTGYADTALDALAQLFEDRRQYERAAEYWSEGKDRFGDPNQYRSKRFNQITDNWGRFEPNKPQPAGEPATLEYRFRNGDKVHLTAQSLDIDQLLTDVKDYLKSNPRQLDWNKINIQQIGYRLVTQNETKYITEEVADWTEELSPRPHHYDRRVTLQTPLEEAGAYLVTAKMAAGNTSKVVVWLADTTLVQFQVNNGTMYFVADARSGKPVERANVEYFGYRQVPTVRDGKHTGAYHVETTNFAERSDAKGLVRPDNDDLPSNYNWLVVARGADRYLAYLGFQGIWYSPYYDYEYNETKVMVITDRPVYRPGHEVNVKFWIRHAQYDQEDVSQFANTTVTLTVNNPKGESIYQDTVTTDEYGGAATKLTLPEDATLGQYQVHLGYGRHGGETFRVEEYKKPEYEVLIDAPSEPVMLGEKISAKVTANYYFGSPVTQATVKYKVTRNDHSANWYPWGPWDWCYGPGYWWFCYDYPWYPGWKHWVGCRMPSPWWWWGGYQQPPEIVAEQEVEIGPDGTIEIEIDTAVAQELHGDTDHRYTITAEVRDQSRRTIVGTGEVLVARKPFQVYTWLDRGYYNTGDTINASFLAQTLDRKPVEGSGQLTLLKITYDEDRQPIETPVRSWQLNTNNEGRAQQKITASAKGQYRLAFEVADEADHTIEGGYLFTIIGDDFDGAEYRFNAIELIPDQQDYAPGEEISLQINTDQVDSTVLLFVRPANGVYLDPEVITLDGKSTVRKIDVIKKDMPNFFVEAVTIAGGQVHSTMKEIVVPPEKRVLNVDVIPTNTEYRPGEKAKVNVRLTDHTGENFEGTTVVSIYDKSVEYISGGSNVPDIKEFFWKWRRQHQPRHANDLGRYFANLVRDGNDVMNDLGVFGASVVEELEEFDDDGDPASWDAKSGALGDSYASADSFRADGNSGVARQAVAMSANASTPEPGGFGGGGGGGFAEGADMEADFQQGQPGQPLVEPTVRTNFADTALWVGVLETDATGMAEVELDMPENLTTWKINVWAMGHGTKVGSGFTEVVTRKDLMVRLQAPRFFIQKDEVTLSAIVHNYLSSDKSVTVSLEMPGEELVCIDEPTQIVQVPADGEVRVDWRVNVVREGTATVRMLALTDEESDAMEMQFPVYVHGMLKQEGWAGTIRPEEDTQQVSFTIPSERRVEQSRLEVRYSPTLAGAMVDALPYLADYPYGCTEQTLNRWLPAVVTQQTLIKMNLNLDEIRDKRTNLNAQELGDDRERAAQWHRFNRNPVFDRAEVDRMVKAGLKRLAEMQVSDGGWGWFSGYGERSYPHTTAVVVHGLQVARHNDVPLVPGMLERGMEWLKRYQAQQVQLLKNWEKGVEPRKSTADDLDAMVYMVLVDEGIDNDDMREFLYRDRNGLSVYAKAMFGLALHAVDDEEKLAMVMRNIDQFVVQDSENETAYLKLPQNSFWWYWYGDETEANAYYLKLLARVDPTGVTAPRLVKYLLNNRKHATYWKSTRDTALAVEAFAEYIEASGEAQPDMVVELWLDGELQKEVEITGENLFSYDNKLVLEGESVADGEHTLEVRRRGTGPVYFNVYSINFTLEDYITRAGLEVKVDRKYYKLVRVDAEAEVAGERGQVVAQKVEKYERIELNNLDSVVSGDLVEIELSIESKNDYEYLLFEDMKPAGFEPVDLRSGYNGNELGAYAEFRDDRVSFFVHRLARGNHSVSYRMRAEIPGRFSALPARASAMYAPELKGNSDEIKLFVEDDAE